PLRTARATIAPTPVNLGILAHLEATAAELTQHAQADAAAARLAGATVPAQPANPADLYGWWENLPITNEARRLHRDTVIYRQMLEHAIPEGDIKTLIRRHRCPACRCFGLQWRSSARRAMCFNAHCTDRFGASRLWTLEQIAVHHIQEKRSCHRATS
ncbi:hypothetical protein, partial [Streptomyces sp. 8L]|uniref:hypothetical protein n=1 Tax=Streptomyces sp. 8L TaxID=2877242 RepID=UPI001CD1DBF3